MSEKTSQTFNMTNLLSPTFKKTIDNGNEFILDPPEDIFSIDVEAFLSKIPISQPKRQVLRPTDSNIINSRMTSGIKPISQESSRQNFASQKPLKGFGYAPRYY